MFFIFYFFAVCKSEEKKDFSLYGEVDNEYNLEVHDSLEINTEIINVFFLF